MIANLPKHPVIYVWSYCVAKKGRDTIFPRVAAAELSSGHDCMGLDLTLRLAERVRAGTGAL
jgi:hypothetical protein